MLAVFALVVGAAIGIQKFTNRDAGSSSAAAPPRQEQTAAVELRPLKPADVGQFRGFSLQLQTSNVTHPYEQYIKEIAETGANTVCFVVAAFQENGKSTSIFIDKRRAPSDEQFKKLVQCAHDLHLRVVVMPIVLLENPEAGEWRGAINPRNWDDWWEDYNNYILSYAELCAAAKVDMFMVGSELVSTEKPYPDRWKSLVRKVRKVYGGYLSYSANWDHYTPVTWWKDLDVVGMTTYYDLTDGKPPTVERLEAKWRELKKNILDWQKTIGRPILFTEVGWPNQVTCAQFPWDYTRSDKTDPAAQANCYEAFFRTWMDEPAVAGFLVWEWRNYPEQKTGPKDASYVPVGKPCLEVIRKYYQAPGAKAPRLATAPAGPETAPATQAAAVETGKDEEDCPKQN